VVFINTLRCLKATCIPGSEQLSIDQKRRCQGRPVPGVIEPPELFSQFDCSIRLRDQSVVQDKPAWRPGEIYGDDAGTERASQERLGSLPAKNAAILSQIHRPPPAGLRGLIVTDEELGPEGAGEGVSPVVQERLEIPEPAPNSALSQVHQVAILPQFLQYPTDGPVRDSCILRNRSRRSSNEIRLAQDREEEFQPAGLESARGTWTSSGDVRLPTDDPDQDWRAIEVRVPGGVNESNLQVPEPFGHALCHIIGNQQGRLWNSAELAADVPKRGWSDPSFDQDMVGDHAAP
jgi:hypothetical protein